MDNLGLKNIKALSTPKGGNARIVISEKNWLESKAVDQLQQTADLPGMRFAVGMPDLHPGKGQPIGAAFVSQNVIYPHLVGSDIGCGMGVWQLRISNKKVKPDRWEKKLVDLDGPMDNVELHTYLDLYDSVGCEIIAQRQALGTIGGGNHFAEFQVVDKVYDESQFGLAGLSKSSVTLLVHSGSRGLGQEILQKHVQRFGGKGLSSNSLEARQYLLAHNDANRWAEINRALIAARFCSRLGYCHDRLLDVSHNTVLPLLDDEVRSMGIDMVSGHGDSKNQYWIHRKGASPTNLGLVMIPGSRGSVSYLVRPRSENSERGSNDGSFSGSKALAYGGFSLAHGAGRKWARQDVKGKLGNKYTVNQLTRTSLGSRVICRKRDLLYEEAPEAYKNIDIVIDDLVGAGMIDIVATFRPVLTYKTRRK